MKHPLFSLFLIICFGVLGACSSSSVEDSEGDPSASADSPSTNSNTSETNSNPTPPTVTKPVTKPVTQPVTQPEEFPWFTITLKDVPPSNISKIIVQNSQGDKQVLKTKGECLKLPSDPSWKPLRITEVTKDGKKRSICSEDCSWTGLEPDYGWDTENREIYLTSDYSQGTGIKELFTSVTRDPPNPSQDCRWFSPPSSFSSPSTWNWY